jgi:hypothetical protein
MLCSKQDWFDLDQDPVTGPFERGNEILASIKDEDIFNN